MRLWEVQTKKYDQLESYDAAIVLGSFLTYDKEFDRIQFRYSADRLFQAIELYKMGKVKKIVYTGGSGSLLHQDEQEGPYVKRYLMTLGIPETDILIESTSNNTHENALNTKKIIDENIPDGKFLLVTSGFHMRRAEACFKKEGMNITSYSVDRICGPRKYEFDHLFLPSPEVMSVWKVWNHEVVGYLI